MQELKLDLDEEDINGKSALIHAYEDYRKDTMLFLLSLGADLELPNLGNGKTMLLDACLKGYSDLVLFLLKNGSNTEAKDGRGRTVNEYVKMDY